MKKKIIHQIAKRFYDDTHKVFRLPPSLYGGKMGVAIFLARYSKTFNKPEYMDLSRSLVDHSLSYPIDNFSSLANGISGSLYGYLYLINNEYLDGPISFLNKIDQVLENEIVRYASLKNYDLLHGLMGIGIYFIKRFEINREKKYLAKTVNCLINMKRTYNNLSYWLSMKEFNLKYDSIDLGFAHGLPSIVCYLSNVYQYEIETTKIKIEVEFLNKFLTHIMEKFYFKKGYLPSHIDEHTFEDLGERREKLSWCYSEIGLAWALWHSGKIFGNSEWIDIASQVFNNVACRRNAHMGLYDACFCHGTVGMAHIFFRLFNETRDANLLDTCNYWINETIKLKDDQVGLKGLWFNDYDTDKKSHFCREDYGLLNGFSGIGLVMLEHHCKENDFSWDKPLLIF